MSEDLFAGNDMALRLKKKEYNKVYCTVEFSLTTELLNLLYRVTIELT